MPAWVIPAITAAAGLVGSAIAKGKDKRQIDQQEKLNQLQVNSQEELMQYQMGLQRKMWEDTSYSAQKEQMKKAGINPALMYGMGGGGGQSIGNTSANISGAQAPSGSGRETEELTSQGLVLASQMGLLDAQKKNIEADTELKNVEANKRKGVDTSLGETQIASLLQGIDNQKAQQQLTKAQTRVQNLDADLKGRTIEDMVEMVNYETKRACQEAQQAVNDTNVSDATIQDKIKIIKAEAIGALLRNTLTKAQTQKTTTETSQITQEMEQSWIKIQQDWTHLSNEAKTNWIREVAERGGWDDPVDQTMKMITEALNGIILFRTGISQPKSHTPIQGFKR